jgi:hypothetical protein
MSASGRSNKHFSNDVISLFLERVEVGVDDLTPFVDRCHRIALLGFGIEGEADTRFVLVACERTLVQRVRLTINDRGDYCRKWCSSVVDTAFRRVVGKIRKRCR